MRISYFGLLVCSAINCLLFHVSRLAGCRASRQGTIQNDMWLSAGSVAEIKKMAIVSPVGRLAVLGRPGFIEMFMAIGIGHRRPEHHLCSEGDTVGLG
jgi:hypothetical protein